jgi:nitroreductase
MEAIEVINSRRSVRKYTKKEVPDDVVRLILASAMSAPSAGNAQPWHFGVIDDRRLLDEISRIHPQAEMAKDAPLAILVCGDLGLEKYAGNWPLDCAAAVENLLLAAHAIGLGAVWTGVYPNAERMESFRKLLGLPGNMMPHALVPVGYPAEHVPREFRFQQKRIFRNHWPA